MFPSSDEPCISLKDVENGFSKCNSIKYAAYRTAAKLRIIQRASFMDKVQLRVISNVFERHQLQQTENSVQLDQKEVESVLSDIYFAVKKERNIPLEIDYVCRLMYSFLKDIFEKENSNTVQVFSFKVGLTLLCEAKPREKYHYLFEQLADHNNCVSRKKLEIMLMKMTRLIEYLGEGLLFGSELIPGTVESCFQCSAGSLGLSEDTFMNWLMQDPQLLVWLSTLYRMQISETVSHNAKCGICKTYPLVGLRYRCLRCLSYNMCQSCFFMGKLNKKHKLKHPVQEFCYPMTSQQSTKAFLLTLRNRLYKKECKRQYLPALRGDSHDAEFLGRNRKLFDEMEVSSKTVVNGSRISLSRFPYQELQNIILQLERDSENLIPEIDNFCSGAGNSGSNDWQIQLKNCLKKHKAQIEDQVQRLKLLRSYLAAKGSKAFFASTPVTSEVKPESKNKDFIVDLAGLSPIAVQTSKKREKASGGNMLWDNHDVGTYGSKPSWEDVRNGTESFSSKISVCELTNTDFDGMEPKDDEREVELSVWLAGKTLRELESSSNKGLTWLRENENGTCVEEKVCKENEETLDKIQSDLKSILKKLQELSIVTLDGEDDEREIEDGKAAEVDVVGQVDSLFLDLISGIGKLVGS